MKVQPLPEVIVSFSSHTNTTHTSILRAAECVLSPSRSPCQEGEGKKWQVIKEIYTNSSIFS